MDQEESEKEIVHFYHSIIESESDAIITSDASKCIRSWNKGAEKIFGYKKKEIIGKPITLIIPKIYHAEHDKGMDRLNNNMDPKVIGQVKERSGLRNNGTEFPIELTLGLWKDKGVNYYSAIIRDISKRKENEGLIQEQNKRFQVISSSKNDAIITSDETKRILSWNKGAEHIFGYVAEEAIGQPITLIIPKQLHERHNMGMDRMNRGEPPRVIGEVLELMAIKNGGEDFPIELTLGSWDNNGKKYYSGIIRDISEKKQAEEALEKANEIIKGQKERMEKELNAAHEIQMSMVPLTFPPFPERKEFSIYATLEPALEVGGDFYDFFFIDEDRLCFCVGDVSGKGVPAALFMAVTRTMIKSKASSDPSTASILTFVNEQISQENPKCMFVTLWVGVLDVRTGEVTYTNAGHNPPYLKRVDGSLEKLDMLHGPVVGVVEGLVYGEDKLKISSEDLLLVFTDGVTEEIDVNDELYGNMRLETLLSEMTVVSVERSVQDVVASVREFQGESKQDDDITVLALQFHA